MRNLCMEIRILHMEIQNFRNKELYMDITKPFIWKYETLYGNTKSIIWKYKTNKTYLWKYETL